jgi:hypothetical protein
VTGAAPESGCTVYVSAVSCELHMHGMHTCAICVTHHQRIIAFALRHTFLQRRMFLSPHHRAYEGCLLCSLLLIILMLRKSPILFPTTCICLPRHLQPAGPRL